MTVKTIASFVGRFSGALLVLMVFGASSARAASFTVNSTADEVDAAPGNGVCATETGACTLRAAIQETNALPGADSIVLPSGLYTITIPPTTSTDTTGSFDIRDDLTIEGAGAADTVVDGGALDNVFVVSGMSKRIHLSNLTIQNGSVPALRSGGGIFSSAASNSITLTDVVVQNNHAGDGGGIYNRGTLTLLRTTVRGNSATRVASGTPSYRLGGGIYHSGGTLSIRDSTIADNVAIAAGGLYTAGTAVIEGSTISGNTATNSTLQNGEAGGGIVNGNGSTMGLLTITNSTISGNRAYGHHGGLYNSRGSVMLNSVTITDNRADADGDGYGNSGGVGQGSFASIAMRNTVLAGNDAAGAAKDCLNLVVQAIETYGYNLIGNTGDCAFAPVAGDVVGTAAAPVNPRLKPLADNGGPTRTHAPMDASPVLDGGDPAGCSTGSAPLASDQRGAPRAVSGNGTPRCDIGAYELTALQADAGSGQRVQPGTLVLLDGSGSAGWGGIASYQWTQTDGVPVALAAADSATPSFTAPAAGGVLTFRLTVTDRTGATASDTVIVSVNAPPLADAGTDQTVNIEAAVSLNGTASTDSDGSIVSYAWQQTGGTAVTLAGADGAIASFTAPASGGVLTFALTVTDNEGATHTDSVTVTVSAPLPDPNPPEGGNKPPVANAGADKQAHPRATVALSGRKSYDPDGKIVSYRWRQTSGVPVNLLGPSWSLGLFVAPKVEGALTFELTVTDNKGATATDTVTVVVDHCARRWYHRFFEKLGFRHGCR